MEKSLERIIRVVSTPTSIPSSVNDQAAALLKSLDGSVETFDISGGGGVQPTVVTSFDYYIAKFSRSYDEVAVTYYDVSTGTEYRIPGTTLPTEVTGVSVTHSEGSTYVTETFNSGLVPIPGLNVNLFVQRAVDGVTYFFPVVIVVDLDNRKIKPMYFFSTEAPYQEGYGCRDIYPVEYLLDITRDMTIVSKNSNNRNIVENYMFAKLLCSTTYTHPTMTSNAIQMFSGLSTSSTTTVAGTLQEELGISGNVVVNNGIITGGDGVYGYLMNLKTNGNNLQLWKCVEMSTPDF